MTIESQLAAIQKKLEELLEEPSRAKGLLEDGKKCGESELGPPPALELPRIEIRSFSLWRAVVSECLGTLLYVFFVCGVSIPWTGHFPPFLSVAFASALAYGALTYSILPGAHLNPTFTLALALVLKRVTPLRAVLFITAQAGGAIAGAAILFGLTVTGYQGTLGGTTIASHITPLQALGLELILSFVLTLAWVSSWVKGQGCIPTTVALLAASLVALPATGAGLNPIRSLGPAFVMNKWPNHWVFWLGPLLGGLAAAYFHQYILRVRPKKTNKREGPQGDSDSLSDIVIPIGGGLPPERSLFLPPESSRHPQPRFEPIYGGTRSLYMKPSPILPRSNLCRSQSVYQSKRYETQPEDKSEKHEKCLKSKYCDEERTKIRPDRGERGRAKEKEEYYASDREKYTNYEDEDDLYELKMGRGGPSTAPPSILVSGPPSYESETFYFKGGVWNGINGGKTPGEKRQERRENHANRLLASNNTNPGVEHKMRDHSEPKKKYLKHREGEESHTHSPSHFPSKYDPNEMQMNDLSRKFGEYSSQVPRKPYEYLSSVVGGGAEERKKEFFESEEKESSNYATYTRILEPLFNSKPPNPHQSGGILSNGGILGLSPSHPNHSHHHPVRNDQITYSFH